MERPSDPHEVARLPYVYRGTVIDNKDPKKLGRVRLVVHAALGNQVTTDWAWPASMSLGGIPNEGSLMVPNKNATVFVMFENGDANKPVYFGSWWGAPDRTPEIPIAAHSPANEISQKPPKGTDTAVKSWGRGIIQQPGPKSQAVYPNNRVVRLPNNDLLLEMDDTPGKGRLSWWMGCSESWMEIDHSGEQSNRIGKNRYTEIDLNDRTHIGNDREEVVDGNGGTHVLGNESIETGGTHKVKAGTKFLVTAPRVVVEATGGSTSYSLTSSGKANHTFLEDCATTVMGNYSLTVMGNMSVTVAGNISTTSGGNITTSALGQYARMAGITITDVAPFIRHNG